jgi:ubiquinone/menaquinone biosynthesis C-methylase UbiE
MAERVCPPWVGHLLASPLRKLFQNPQKILGPYVDSGMTVLDVGCAMGFFSLPLAEMVGPGGKVVCVDLQEKMLQALVKRAVKAGLRDRIAPRLCPKRRLGLEDLRGTVDFALAFAVVHEVPEAPAFFSEIYETLKQGGRSLVAEPRGHVSRQDFDRCISVAENAGFRIAERPRIKRSRSILLGK